MSHGDHADEELLQRWRDGDGTAGEALFERHYDGVSRFFRNKVSDPADLVQRTFLALLENAEGFRGDSSFRTFLFGIAKNVLLKHFRARSGPRGKVELGTVSVVDLGESPSHVVADDERRRLLLRALRRLTIEQQMILELHYWEQMKVSDLAQVVGVPAGTLKTRMRAARKRLEELLVELAATPSQGQSTISRLDEWAERLRENMGSGPAQGGGSESK